MTAATRRYVDVDGPDMPHPTVDLTDGWHVSLAARARFDYVAGGSIQRSVPGTGLGEFDSFVARFAPSSYDTDRITTVIETHMSSMSPITYRAAGVSGIATLVGASYKTTIDEVLGAVWEGCVAALVREAADAGVTEPVHLECVHPTAQSVARVLSHGAGIRANFGESICSALDSLDEVASGE